MKTIEFWIAGEARPEAKTQLFFKNRRTNQTRVGPRVDLPDRITWKYDVMIAAKEAGVSELVGPIVVCIMVFKPKPKSHPKHPTKNCPYPDYWITRPDAENFIKPISDALTGIAWNDDAQIIDLRVGKRYGHENKTLVRITAIEMEDLAEEVELIGQRIEDMI